MGFSRQEYWSGLPCPSLGDLPNPWIKPRSPALQADSLPSEPPGKPFLTFKQGLTRAASQGRCELTIYGECWGYSKCPVNDSF